MFNAITVVGLGSIGGFLSTFIGQYIIPDQLNLIDPDHVVEKNIRNSIYKSKDIGKLKTHVIYDLIKKENKKIQVNRIPYDFDLIDEDIYQDSDLIIDCRDIFNKKKIFDIKIYIAENFLILDGKKEDLNNNICKKSFYTIEKDEIDIKKAVLIIISLFKNNGIQNIIDNNKIAKFDLNLYEKKFNEMIIPEDDIIYDNSEIEVKNLNQCVKKILKCNKKKKIFLETIDKVKTFPENYFETIDDLLTEIETIEKKSPVKRFFLDVEENKDNMNLILIPEWGSA